MYAITYTFGKFMEKSTMCTLLITLFFCGGVKVPGIPDLEIRDFEPNFHA